MILKLFKTKFLLTLCFVVFSISQVNALDLKINDDEIYIKVASNFLSYINSDKSITHNEKIMDNDDIIGNIFHLNSGGYIIVPVSELLAPIKYYSLSSEFSELPKAYIEFIISELKFYFHQSKYLRKKQKNDRWNFLLNYSKKRSAFNYVPDTFLLTTKWNQRFPYNKYLPEIDGRNAVAGCVQIATAQIMNYHKHPSFGRGVLKHVWNEKEYKAVVSRNYNWNILLDKMYYQEPVFIQDEIGLLIRDITILNEAKYGLDGTSAYLHTDQFIYNFKYATDIKKMTNENEDQFFLTIKDEIDNGRPVYLSFPGHATVADGYASDPTGKKIHINMGWGGYCDDYYFLNETVSAGGYQFAPELDIKYNIKPCSYEENNCFESNRVLEDTDILEANTIEGKFNSAGDVDLYEVYLNGKTSIKDHSTQWASVTGKLYDKSFYYITHIHKSWYDDTLQLEPGKYFIEISGRDEHNGIEYKFIIETEDISPEELKRLDHPPVMTNDLKNIEIDKPHSILLNVYDEDGTPVTLNATSSNDAISITLENNILHISPEEFGVHSLIEINANSTTHSISQSFYVITYTNTTLVEINDLKDIYIQAGSGEKEIFLYPINQSNKEIKFSATSTYDDVEVNLTNNILKISPLVINGYSQITVQGISTDGIVEKSFFVIIYDQEKPINIYKLNDIIVKNLSTPLMFNFIPNDSFGDEFTYQATTSNSDIIATIEKNKLTIESQLEKGYAKLIVQANSENESKSRMFIVLMTGSDIPFGKEYQLSGKFNCDDLDSTLQKFSFPVILDGTCKISGYRGYSNQAFYLSVFDKEANLLDCNEESINLDFLSGHYTIMSTLKGCQGGYYHCGEDYHKNYKINISCPSAKEFSSTIANYFGISIDTTIELIDLIVALQILSDIDPQTTLYKDLDFNKDSKIGIEDASYILMELSEIN